MRRYAVYKGLQKPLIFKGFQGKFIYWGVACLLAGLILGALTMALFNGWLGAIVLVSCIVGGLFYIAGRQKKGLHVKNSDQAIQLHSPRLKKLSRYAIPKNI